MANRNMSVRIDDVLLDKIHYIADYNCRSVSKQVLVLIRECVENFESNVEVIPVYRRHSIADNRTASK